MMYKGSKINELIEQAKNNNEKVVLFNELEMDKKQKLEISKLQNSEIGKIFTFKLIEEKEIQLIKIFKKNSNQKEFIALVTNKFFDLSEEHKKFALKHELLHASFEQNKINQ